MKIHFDHLPIVFEHARKLRVWLATHCQGADKVPVSLDDITAGILALYKVSIEVRLVRFDSDEISGFIEIYDGNRAIIYLDSELNSADTRYVFVKEACHIMLFTDENATRDPAAMIEYYVHARSDIDERKHPAEVICEEVTKYGALELLYPPELRKEHHGGELSHFAIAENLVIPEYLVEYCLLDYNMDLFDRIRGTQVDGER